METEKLAKQKLGTVSDEEIFKITMKENFTLYYEPLIPWVNRLRREVFPNGGKWKKEDPELSSLMKEILREARKELPVLQGSITA